MDADDPNAPVKLPPLSCAAWVSEDQARRWDVRSMVTDAQANRCDFVALPIVKPTSDIAETSTLQVQADATKLDGVSATLTGNLPLMNLVGVLSSWLDLDASSQADRARSESAFKEQVAYAAHLGLPAVMIPRTSYNSSNLWATVHQTLLALTNMQVWVCVPLSVPPEHAYPDTYRWWDRMRMACEHIPNLGVVLELTADIPEDKSALTRWLGEPVRALSMSTSIFLTNKMGQPVLSRKHQALVKQFCKLRVQLMVHGDLPEPGTNTINAYLRYLHYLWTNQDKLTQQDEWERPYYDYLQAPLQPLQDNLENATYQVFEKDPVKYVNYEDAVYKALVDAQEADPKYIETPVCIMVVGAGRGPLVMCSSRAAARAKQPVELYAIEKNPNAVVYLEQLKIADPANWGAVTIVSTDMRVWGEKNKDKKADILVSELLGSFGDNELSPECLDGAQKYLAPGGISIPCKCTSQLAPITSSKLHNEVKAYGDLKHFETPYVVKFHNVNQLADAKECFIFDTPNFPLEGQEYPDNTRYRAIEFNMEQNATLHGLAGFFDSQLYKDVNISINPETFSVGMFSWFPLFFPLRWPMNVRAGSKVTVHIWRRVDRDRSKVWYEWLVDVDGTVSTLHNPNGRSYYIGL